MNLETKQFTLDKNYNVNLFIPKTPYFQPNRFTGFLLYTLKDIEIAPSSTIFELGAGIGVISVELPKQHRNISSIISSEIVGEQVEAARENIHNNGLVNTVTALHGDLFEPIRDYFKSLELDPLARLIVSDASGMSDFWGNTLCWYPQKVPKGGDLGNELTLRSLEQAPQFSKKIIYPALPNFEPIDAIHNTAKLYFKNVVLLSKKNMLLAPTERKIVAENKSKLYSPIIEQTSRKHYWTAEIWQASDPR
jgi:hypothetical protein